MRMADMALLQLTLCLWM